MVCDSAYWNENITYPHARFLNQVIHQLSQGPVWLFVSNEKYKTKNSEMNRTDQGRWL